MNEIQEFVNQKLGTVRTVNVDGKIYFMAKDVAVCLGYKNTNKAVNDHCKRAIMIWGNDSLGRHQEYKVIPEGDVYRLISRSKLPSAEEFESWIFEELLPQIRKTGGYIPIKKDEPDELIMARAVQIANETIKHKDEIIANQKRKIASLEETEKDWKLLMDTKGTFSINEIAHFIGIGEYKLFSYMRNIGLLFKNENGDNVPYENVVNKTKFISVPAIAPDGTAHVQTRVKPDGISYITKLLRKYGYLEVA